MIALIRKDLDWLLIFLLFGLGVFTYILLCMDFDFFWVLPGNNNYKKFHLIYSLGGIALGIMAALREEFSRTEEFLRHRAVSPSQIYFAKLLACTAVMLAWIIIPLLLSLSRGLWSDNASIIRYDPLWYTMGTCVVMFSSFSICLFAGTMRISLLKRAIIGGMGYWTLMYISYVLTRLSPESEFISILFYMSVHIAFILFSLFAAYLNMIRVPEPDRCKTLITLLTSGSLVTVFIAAVAGSWISDQQGALQNDLYNEFPAILDHESDGYILATWKNHDLLSKREYIEVNERHDSVRSIELPRDEKRRIIRLPKRWGINNLSRSHYLSFSHRKIGDEVSLFDHNWLILGSLVNSKMIYHSRSDGMINLIQYSTEKNPATPCKIKIGKGPEGKPFSNYVRSSSRSSLDDYLMLADLKEGTIWYYDLNEKEKHSHRIHLPDEDRVRGIREIGKYQLTNFSDENFNPEDFKEYYILAEGDYAYYLWNGTVFLRQRVDLEKERFSRPTPPMCPDPRWLVTLETDPLSPACALQNGNYEILFSHKFDLYTDTEKWLGAQIYGLSLCRIPLVQMLSYLGTTQPCSTFSNVFLIDPLLASQKRFWLLATNLLLSACLAFLAIWRLIRFNAERNRLLYWGILIFLSGIGGYVVYRLFETKRAYRISTVVRPEEVPPMVIQSV